MPLSQKKRISRHPEKNDDAKKSKRQKRIDGLSAGLRHTPIFFSAQFLRRVIFQDNFFCRKSFQKKISQVF